MICGAFPDVAGYFWRCPWRAEVEDWEPTSPKAKDVLGTDGYIAPESYLGALLGTSEPHQTAWNNACCLMRF